jgi:hypothetical protein
MRRTGFYAVLILLVLVAIPAATQLTVQQNGNVAVGTSTKVADLQVYGIISGSGAVPVGAVLDWWRPKGSTVAVPSGFQICDGSMIVDKASPYVNQYTPDLTNEFIRGVTLSAIGTFGGNDSTQPGAYVWSAGSHSHALPSFTGGVYDGGDDPGAAPYYARDDNKHNGQYWSSDVHISIDAGTSTQEGQHRHGLGGNTVDAGSHNHSVSIDPVSTVPAYCGLLKIMRIR